MPGRAWFTLFLFLWFGMAARCGFAAQDVRVNFTLNTTDVNGNPIQESRYYYIYRPDGLSTTAPAPMLLVLEPSVDSGPETDFHNEADRDGFILVSCSYSGNSTGKPATKWSADDPNVVGYEDVDYLSAVISQVRTSNNANDAFVTGLSKGGHMALAYACVRPSMLKGAASMGEYMGLTFNIPSAQLPILMIQGTADSVPYTLVKDTVDAWRAVDSLLDTPPVMTVESSPLAPGMVSQATWRDDSSGEQVAFVTLVGGSHTVPTSDVETGYDGPAGIWAFFSQFLTPAQNAPQVVFQPEDGVQVAGQPASFRVSATGAPPMNYQWQRNGANIPGATSNYYTLPVTSQQDSGAMFRVVVSNASGSVTSAPAKLTVKAGAASGITISSQPQDTQAVAGQPASFSVSASGPGTLSYQWQENGFDIAGATGSTLNIPTVLTSDGGAAFTVRVSSGSASVAGLTSNRAMLTVSRAQGAPILLTYPARSVAMPGQNGGFSVKAWSTSPMSYQWQQGAADGNMVNIAGATGSTYTKPSTTDADSGTVIRCVVSNAAGSVTSASELLLVSDGPLAPTEIVSPLTAVAQVGVPFRYTIQSYEPTLPVTYSASGLPAGLTLDPNTGIISGSPTAAGTASITVGASNSAGKASATLALTVSAGTPVLTSTDWRRANFGVSANDPTIAGSLADPDGDGYLNGDEFTFGSNPLDATSVPAAAVLDPVAFYFGTMAPGGSLQAQFTITNNGPGSFSGTALVQGGAYSVVSGGSFTISPGASAQIVVAFNPQATGAFTDVLTVVTNGGSAQAALIGQSQLF